MCRSSRSAWRSTLLLVAAVTLARLVYLAWGCPYSLVEDEAYYWMWSRHLDFSYLTKGPGVALTIAAGVGLAGDTELGVRLSAPLWGALLALGVGGLAGELSRVWRGSMGGAESRARFWGAALALLSPALQASAIVMTIDGPMLACWAIALWQAVRCLDGELDEGARARALLLAGLAITAGTLFKPTVAVLIPPVVVAWWGATRDAGDGPGHAWARSVVLAFVAVSLVGFAPQVLWNAARGWPMAEHLVEHVRQEGVPGLTQRATWVAEYVALQAALAGIGVCGAVAAWIARRNVPREAPERAVWRLVWMAAGVPYGLYALVACFTRVEGNWALGGMLPLLGMTGAWVGALGRQRATPHARRVGLAGLAVGLVTGLGMLRLDLIARVPVLGDAVPVGRLMGGAALGERVREILTDLESRTNTTGFVMADHYGRAALLEFYLNAGRTGAASIHASSPPARVACASWALGGRMTQFDLWPGSSMLDPALHGRPAVLLGGRHQGWEPLFGEVETIEPIPEDHKRRGVFLGFAYRARTR